MNKKPDNLLGSFLAAAAVLTVTVATPLGLSSQCDKDAKRLKVIAQIAKPSKSEKDEVELIYSRPAYESICRVLNTPLKEEEQRK